VSDLHDLIRQVAADYPTAQPDEVARHVAKLTPKQDVAACYEQALRPLVADVFRSSRNTAIAAIQDQQPFRQSPKVAGIRSWWQDVINERVYTGEVWKLLGDCDKSDLLFCAAERRAHAAATIRLAEFYEDLAARLDQETVTTVRQLKEPKA
jgi:hypothetical protein